MGSENTLWHIRSSSFALHRDCLPAFNQSLLTWLANLLAVQQTTNKNQNASDTDSRHVVPEINYRDWIRSTC